VVWALPISLAATFGISGGSLPFLISCPGLLRWFSSPSVAFLSYFIQIRNDGITSVGLPHSAIQGSQDMCSFPWLFAAYHGLLRLVAPRHPPYTSIRLTILSFLFFHFPAGVSPAFKKTRRLSIMKRRMVFLSFSSLQHKKLPFFVLFVPFPDVCQISRASYAIPTKMSISFQLSTGLLLISQSCWA
jgi:hypothetical protein